MNLYAYKYDTHKDYFGGPQYKPVAAPLRAF